MLSRNSRRRILYPVALAALLRAGLIAVNVNPLYTARELEHQLKDSGAEAVIVLENFATTLQQAIGNIAAKHVVVASMGDLLGFPKGLILDLPKTVMALSMQKWARCSRNLAKLSSSSATTLG